MSWLPKGTFKSKVGVMMCSVATTKQKVIDDDGQKPAAEEIG
jgi:hypothetical protein